MRKTHQNTLTKREIGDLAIHLVVGAAKDTYEKTEQEIAFLIPRLKDKLKKNKKKFKDDRYVNWTLVGELKGIAESLKKIID